MTMHALSVNERYNMSPKKKKKEKKTEKSMKMLDHCHMISENSEVDIFLSTSSPCHFLFCLTINRKEGAHTFRLRLNVNLSWTTTNICVHTTEVKYIGTTCIILPGKC